ARDGIQPCARRSNFVSLEEITVPLASLNPQRFATRHAGFQGVCQYIRRYREREVALEQMLQATPYRMGVCFIDTGHSHFPAKINQLSLVSTSGLQLPCTAHGFNFSITYRNGFNPSLFRFLRINTPIHD